MGTARTTSMRGQCPWVREAYARQFGLRRFGVVFGGVAFMFSGFMLAHVSHWTMIGTVA